MNTLNNDNFTFQSNNFHYSHASEMNLKQEDYYRHSHTRYELYVFFGGDADFLIEDRMFKMSPNMVLLIPPHTYHYATLKNSDKPYNRLVLNFDRAFVFPELHPLLDAGKNPFKWEEKKHAPLLQDLESNLVQYQKRDGALLVQLFLNRILIDMKYSQKSLIQSSALNPTITQILTCINEHINEPLSLKSLSEYTFLNPSYLSQIFNSYMKIGVMDYVKQKKIYLAEEMIRTAHVPPTEASKRLGFTDYSTFYRLYKKYLNENPSTPPIRRKE